MRRYMVSRGWVVRRKGKDEIEYRRPRDSRWIPHNGSWSVDAASWVGAHGYRYVSSLEACLLFSEESF